MKVDFTKLNRLLKFADKYEISIQFWPEQQAIYIEKNGVDLYDYGGEINDCIDDAIKYLRRINKKGSCK